MKASGRHIKILSFILMIALSLISRAGQSVVLGPVYPVIEDDLIDYLKSQSKRIAISQKMHEYNEHWVDNINKSYNQSVNASVLLPRKHTLVRHFDPSIVAKNGRRLNPLNFVALNELILFYNSNDLKQKKWLKQYLQKTNGPVKLIIIQGSISDEVTRLKRAIYFDRSGRLLNRFRIKHVPAVIQQDHLMLKITEYEV